MLHVRPQCRPESGGDLSATCAIARAAARAGRAGSAVGSPEAPRQESTLDWRPLDTFDCANQKRPSQAACEQALAKGTQGSAERTGFEPADPLRGHGFSKPALSTAQPPLR